VDAAVLAARQLASQRAIYRAIGRGPCARLIERDDGVLAYMVPSLPGRSLVNAVLYTDGAALLAARDDLARAFAGEGVRAWTVWVRPGDEATASGLAAAGHAHDAQPMLMAAPLEEVDLARRRDVELDRAAGWDAIARLWDGFFGHPPEASLRPVLGHLDAPAYVALEDGEPAACAGARYEDGDCIIAFVATLPAARGRGLAGELLRIALADARAAGCTTTSLEATRMGEHVYARLGYRSLGRLGMWELRVP
jgi:GNAT superfamily N-acetyltransferase